MGFTHLVIWNMDTIDCQEVPRGPSAGVVCLAISHELLYGYHCTAAHMSPLLARVHTDPEGTAFTSAVCVTFLSNRHTTPIDQPR